MPTGFCEFNFSDLDLPAVEKKSMRSDGIVQSEGYTLVPVWWIALSGGVDSCVLLHALNEWRAKTQAAVELRALHVNHQISPHANEWQSFCESLCATYKIPFYAEKVQVNNRGRGIEDAAREARYAVFEKHMASGDYLFLGHHADDQAETLLLRILRGAGPKGLSAMAQTRALGAGYLFRPLLRWNRDAILRYAETQQLQWINDESNSNNLYDRNYLRNLVIPLLRERWPEYATQFQQAANLSAESDTLNLELAQMDLQSLNLRAERVGHSIDLRELKKLSVPRQNNVLRAWLASLNFAVPEFAHLQQIHTQLINGRDDAEAQVNLGDLSLRVFRERLFALSLSQLPKLVEAKLNEAKLNEAKLNEAKLDETKSKHLDMPLVLNVAAREETVLTLATGATLIIKNASSETGQLLRSDLPNLRLRVREGGERAQPVERAHSQTLKRLFQEYALEPWLRDTWPLIYSGDQLVAVPGLWVCKGYEAEHGFDFIYFPFQKPAI